MRDILIGLFVGLGITLLANTELSNDQKLRAQIFQLKVQLSQCQVSANNAALTNERDLLINEFSKTLEHKDGQEFDWTSLKFKEVK